MKATKIIFSAVIYLSFILFANACVNFSSVTGNGNVITQDRNVTGFSGIKASTGINVIISMGEQEKVQVKADENIAALIITEVKDGVLKIYCKENIKKAKSRDVYVTAKEIKSISGSAGVDVKSLNTIKSATLSIGASSGSEVTLSVESSDISCSSSSGAVLKLSGTTKNLAAKASSGSDIKAYDLTSDVCNASSSSGASVKVNVSKDLKAGASSGGDIHYTGNPSNIQKSISSGGGLHKD
ncbi:MAG: DUF2807 domain-containing protein [Bacteroidia bacterium]|nr:DUF2807 domain-containing protein [Bacteroidia bacterium]